MPFERAIKVLTDLTGVQVSEATARRKSYVVGKAGVAVQIERASEDPPEVPEEIRKAKHIVSTDGAMVSLLHGQWAEVKTVAVAQVEAGKSGEPVHSTHVSYFSRMLDAETFTQQASAELLRRGIHEVHQVSAVMDGAEWIDGFVDCLCPQVVFRILDFPHAGEYVNTIGKLSQAAGSVLADNWLASHLHDLKHDGPVEVLKELRQLRDQHLSVEEIGKKLAYLEKRESRMHYPEYQEKGWPIGSGMVESGNKVVMQARLKGAGMHWAPPHVNPLLALRCSACNDLWDEDYEQAQIHIEKQRLLARDERRRRRYEQHLRCLHVFLLMWQWRSSKPRPIVDADPSSSERDAQALPSSGNQTPPLAKQASTLPVSDNHTSTLPSPVNPSKTISLPDNPIPAVAAAPPFKPADILHSLPDSIPAITTSPPEMHPETRRPPATHPWRRRLLAKK